MIEPNWEDFVWIFEGQKRRRCGRIRKQVRLRGTNSGAWMNMENFMNGFPGCEHRLRFFAKQILGEELGSYFFDSMLGIFSLRLMWNISPPWA